MRRLAWLAIAVLLLPRPAGAQESPALVKYGKWLVAAGAVGMNLLAAQAHARADDQFSVLEARCFADHSLCDLAGDGTYADPTSEQLYQASLDYDNQARAWLIGGETALLGATAMFVWEFTRHSPKPDNIPFEPEVRSLYRATGIGVRVGF